MSDLAPTLELILRGVRATRETWLVDYLTLGVRVVEAFAWPGLLGFGTFLFRRELRQLLERINRLRYGDLAADLEAVAKPSQASSPAQVAPDEISAKSSSSGAQFTSDERFAIEELAVEEFNREAGVTHVEGPALLFFGREELRFTGTARSSRGGYYVLETVITGPAGPPPSEEFESAWYRFEELRREWAQHDIPTTDLRLVYLLVITHREPEAVGSDLEIRRWWNQWSRHRPSAELRIYSLARMMSRKRKQKAETARGATDESPAAHEEPVPSEPEPERRVAS
ncbi:MAG TPA: hypothetical protein VNB06_14060 [Thermoanaerobaculia bacterium]|nr:hypothetical protein [Thermoanaerobaculia bacterium]